MELISPIASSSGSTVPPPAVDGHNLDSRTECRFGTLDKRELHQGATPLQPHSTHSLQLLFRCFVNLPGA
jgi:hypothetical protein